MHRGILWVALTAVLMAIAGLLLYLVFQRPFDEFLDAHIGKSDRLGYPDSSQSVVPASPASPSNLVDLPPLYPGLRWRAAEGRRTVFKTRTGQLIESESYVNESERLKTYPDDFVAYYKRELTVRGWVQTMEATSGISGYYYGYEQDGRYIMFGVFVFGGHDQSRYQAFVEHS